MAAAGYDPHAALNAWSRLKESYSDSGLLSLLTSHPSRLSRERARTEALPDALKTYSRAAAQYGKGVRLVY